MNVNLLLKQFDELTDSEVLVISFKEFNPILVDNDDIIRVNEGAIQIKGTTGNIVVNTEELNGFQVIGKLDIVKMMLSKLCGE